MVGSETPVDITTAASVPDLAAQLAGMTYRNPFRTYQNLALDAFERARAASRRRTYVAMPPGSGKTVIGLEIARRLGHPTLVLGPNTAIQSQWLKQWSDFQPQLVPASPDPDLSSPLTVLTYQQICVLDRDVDGDIAGSDATDRARRRRLIARGGRRKEVLGLLHPNGRAIVDRIAAGGASTIVLDECHHLLELWGHLVEAVLDEIGKDAFVVGLTATPPGDMEAAEAQLYERLFGHADFEVVTPAVVKEGHLAPYQELAYFTRPLPHEEEYVADQQRRFDDLLIDVLDPSFASQPFALWLDGRIVQRQTNAGARLGWSRFEQDEPDLALAGLRFLWSRHAAMPPDAPLREQHRRVPTAADWMVLLEAYVRDVLDTSADPRDASARERIRHALPAIGYQLARDGIRGSISVVDRVLSLSASKSAATIEILTAEHAVLGQHLRALVLCDYEVAGREVGAKLEGILDPQAGSAALLMHVLLSSRSVEALHPLLVTGSTVACSRSTAVSFVRWAAEVDAELAPALLATDPFTDASARGPAWQDLVVVDPADPRWMPRRYVPLVTRYFEEGHVNCLVGTRGLLGEGWDAHSVNVVVDLTAAATSTSVHQMRGRSLRLDPDLPHKVADNWDVVCVASEHAKGDADYARFVRKHRSYFALTAAGEIESGVSQVDPVLSPYGPPADSTFDGLNQRMLARVGERDDTYARWRIGEPYANVQAETVRVHVGRSLGLPGVQVTRRLPPNRTTGQVRSTAIEGGAVAVLLVLAGWALGAPFVGLGAGLALALVLGVWSLRFSRGAMQRLQPSDTLDDLASALAEALVAAGLVSKPAGPDRVRILAQPDGYYRCYLDGASSADAATFAEALDELLEPLADPRWIIPRRVADPPRSLLGTLAFLVRRRFGRAAPGLVVHHALPSVLATRRENVLAFEKAWDRWVSPGAHALSAHDPRAAAVLELHRGDDPFGIETQMRTLWY